MKRRIFVSIAVMILILAAAAWHFRPIGEYFGPECFILFIDGVSYCHTDERGHRALTECLGYAYMYVFIIHFCQFIFW